jgi:cytochrome b561
LDQRTADREPGRGRVPVREHGTRPARGEIFTWHKTIGVTILLLSLVRLGWRLANPPPPYPDAMPRWERIAGTWNHRIFYALLLALPLTGLAAVSGGAGTAFTPLVGGIPFPLIPGLSEEAGDAIGGLHGTLVFTTLALLAIHIAAALKHQFVDRARYAGRMPPFRSPDGEVAVAPAGQPGAAS